MHVDLCIRGCFLVSSNGHPRKILHRALDTARHAQRGYSTRATRLRRARPTSPASSIIRAVLILDGGTMEEMGSLDDHVLSSGHEDDPGNQRDDSEAKRGGTMEKMGSLDDPVVSSVHDGDASMQRHDDETKGGGTDEVDESDQGTRNLNMLVSEAEKGLIDQNTDVEVSKNEIVISDCEVKYSRHNKPKKVGVNVVEAADYVCDKEDIELIKSVAGVKDEKIVVRVDDAFVSYENFKCLLRRSAFLNGDVINAYIKLINAENHLLCRGELTVYLENSLIFCILHRDGKFWRENNPNVKEDPIVERVTSYVTHDMVFIPINIELCHWYLAVVNASKRQIQVLDSLGLMRRDELKYAVQGLQRQINIALRVKDVTKIDGYKWPDLMVESWDIAEQIIEPIQSDGASCGLFLLNFMEYWTGEKLSDSCTQNDMVEFRPKLAAILLDSPLNTAKEIQDDDTSGGDDVFDPNDCIIIEPTQQSQLTQLIKSSYDIAGAICDYILSITDHNILKEEWVKSSKPHPININLEQIQDILDLYKPMSHDVFNLAVRMIACNEITFMRDPKCHFLDLKFAAVCNYRRSPKYRVKHETVEWSKFFYDWPHSGVLFSEREVVLVPFHSCGRFSIISLHMKDKFTAIIDPTPLPEWAARIGPYYYYLPIVQKIVKAFGRAMETVNPSWNEDVYDWPQIYPGVVPK